MKKPARIRTTDRDLMKVQDNITNVVDNICALPLSDAVVLDGVSLEMGLNRINHGLQRQPRGYLLCGRDSPVVVSDAEAHTTKFLNLNSSGAATVKLIVF